jgi:hypothetical protein
MRQRSMARQADISLQTAGISPQSSGLQLLVYEALTSYGMRPYGYLFANGRYQPSILSAQPTSLCVLKLLVYEAFSY